MSLSRKAKEQEAELAQLEQQLYGEPGEPRRPPHRGNTGDASGCRARSTNADPEPAARRAR
jgi:hypothetical protein